MSVYRITSLQQLLLTHPTRLSHLLVHPSFPLQDSFANCFPSRYGLYSVKASSTHGDTWLEKSSPSDEPDRKKQQESGSDQRYTLKGSRNSKGSWFAARDVDSQQGSWYVKILDYEKRSPWKNSSRVTGSWTGSKNFLKKRCFNNFYLKLKRCQAGSSKGFSNNKKQNPPTIWSNEPRPIPGIFFWFKTKGWLGSFHIKGVSIDTPWFLSSKKHWLYLYWFFNVVDVRSLCEKKSDVVNYCICFLPHSWFFAPICSGKCWPTCNDGWICSGYQDAQSAMVTHFGLCEATWIFWREIWMKEMT